MQENNVNVNESPSCHFSDLGLSEGMLKALRERNFSSPTPIQEKIIPIILKTKLDVVGKAQTGTGKTAAFGIPLLEMMKPSKLPQALILVPTRELALQVCHEIHSFKGEDKIRVAPIYGGQSIGQQMKWLSKGVDIIVGTPGRILDHLGRKTLNLSALSYLVLDEADEMLNMGFIEDIEEILSTTNEEKRVFLFSATMPPRILSLAQNYMGEYKVVEVKPNQQTVQLIDQSFYKVSSGDKFEALCRLIDFHKDFYGLVFCKTKIEVDEVSAELERRGHSAQAIHGDVSQNQREKILSLFKSKKITVLVATDVAARGIDIQNLGHVINYSLPGGPESYIHRIGRTGRSGREGKALTLVAPEDARKFSFIRQFIKVDIRMGKLPQISEVIAQQKVQIKEQLMEFGQKRGQGHQDLDKAQDLDREYQNLAAEILKETDAQAVLSALLKYTFKDRLNPKRYKEITEFPLAPAAGKWTRDRRKEYFSRGKNSSNSNSNSSSNSNSNYKRRSGQSPQAASKKKAAWGR